MYDCPACGANLKFDPESQDLACSYCGNHYDVGAFDDNKANAEVCDEYDVTIFTCPQCGGELISTDNEAAVFCSYCGASTVLNSRLQKEKRPNQIIPFKITKDQCKKIFIDKVKKTGFAPKELQNPEVIDSFRGIYMPFWSYTVKQEGRVNLNGEETHRRGDYIIHDHYSISGDLDASYEGYAKDSASSFDDDISEAIAPYDIKDAKAFTPAYMSGFYADVSDVSDRVYAAEARDLAFRESMSKIEAVPDVPAGILQRDKNNSVSLHTSIPLVKNMMYPVWFFSYRMKDRIAYAAVNGQTGKVMADIPISKKKYLLTSILMMIPIFVVLNLVFTVIPKVTLIIAMVLSAVTAGVYYSAKQSLQKKENKSADLGWLSKNGGKPQEENSDKKIKFDIWIILSVACIVLSGILIWRNPVSDIWFYGGAFLNMMIILLMIMQMIDDFNLISTRKLPQFNRTGGDDRA